MRQRGSKISQKSRRSRLASTVVLPPEVLCILADYLPIRTLKNFALTCKMYRIPAQQALFKNVIIASRNTLSLYIKTIEQQPRFARPLETLVIANNEDTKLEFNHAVLERLLPRLVSALHVTCPISKISVAIPFDRITRFVVRCILQLPMSSLQLENANMSWSCFCLLWNSLPNVKLVNTPRLILDYADNGAWKDDTLCLRHVHDFRIQYYGAGLSSARFLNIMTASQRHLKTLHIDINRFTNFEASDLVHGLRGISITRLFLSMTPVHRQYSCWHRLVDRILPVLPNLSHLTLRGNFAFTTSSVITSATLQKIHLIDVPIVTKQRELRYVLESAQRLTAFDMTISEAYMNHLVEHWQHEWVSSDKVNDNSSKANGKRSSCKLPRIISLEPWLRDKTQDLLHIAYFMDLRMTIAIGKRCLGGSYDPSTKKTLLTWYR